MKRCQSKLFRMLLIISVFLFMPVSISMADDDFLIVGFRCHWEPDTAGRLLRFQGVLDGAGINLQCPIFNLAINLNSQNQCESLETTIRPLLEHRCILSPTTIREGDVPELFFNGTCRGSGLTKLIKRTCKVLIEPVRL